MRYRSPSTIGRGKVWPARARPDKGLAKVYGIGYTYLYVGRNTAVCSSKREARVLGCDTCTPVIFHSRLILFLFRPLQRLYSTDPKPPTFLQTFNPQTSNYQHILPLFTHPQSLTMPQSMQLFWVRILEVLIAPVYFVLIVYSGTHPGWWLHLQSPLGLIPP